MIEMDDSGERPTLELRDYLVVIRRRRWTIACTTIAIVVAAMGFTLIQKPIYSATTSVLLQTRVSERIFQPSQQQQNATPDTTRVATEIEVMQSLSVQKAAAEVLGRSPKVDISARGGTDVVGISAQDPDPKEAARVAQTYAETYVKVRRDQTVQDLLDASTTIQQQVDKLKAQVADLDRPVSDLNSQIAAAQNPDDRARLSQQRDQLQQQNASQIQAVQARITTYTAQLDNLQVAGNLTQTGGAQIVSSAQVPTSPVSPTPLRNALIALFVGALFGIGLAFLREYLDDTIKSKDDVDVALGGLSVLTIVPRVEEWKDPDRTELITRERPKSPAAEAYRTLRTSVQFAGLERPMKLIQITSPGQAEGKTTTLANLGVTLARAGKRVVMVDCDLRRPRVESFFGLPNEVGFTNVVVGNAALGDAVVAVPDEPGLALLPAGPPPPNPSELLSTRRATDVLRALGEEADFVLVDSPPVLPVTDAIVVAGIVDATIVVVTAKRTTRRQVQRALELLQQVDAPLIGAVLNSAAPSDRGYGYAYEYSYGSDSNDRPSRRRGLLSRRKPAAVPGSEREESVNAG
jgi:capsular exopolysaccharide synthesis family protein